MSETDKSTQNSFEKFIKDKLNLDKVFNTV